MEVKIYRAKGTFRQDRRAQPFAIDTRAVNESQVREKVLANIGSKHNIKRRHINIESVEEITKEDTGSTLVQQLS